MHKTVLRGMRLGSMRGAAIQEKEDIEPAPRRSVRFACPKGHEFDVTFAEEAEPPGAWECRQHGTESWRVNAIPEERKVKPPRTHWDMLLERRSIAELELLLAERLAGLHKRS